MTPKQLEAIKRHGEQLNAIFHTGLDPVTLCKKLRRIENAAHKLAEDCCNYLSMESEEYIIRYNIIRSRVISTLGNRSLQIYGNKNIPWFVNLDPRGYALKIDYEYMRAHNLKLYNDWGGYGIIAPEFDKEGR